jgi:integrase
MPRRSKTDTLLEQMRALKPGQKPLPLGGGRYLIANKTGAPTIAGWTRFDGKLVKITIGRWLDLPRGEKEPDPVLGKPVTLAGSAELWATAKRQKKQGIDPRPKRAESPENADRDVFEAVLADFIEKHCKVRQRSWRQTESVLRTHVLPRWKGRAVQSITKRDVRDLLDRLVGRGVPVMANRVHAHARQLFAWAVERDIITVSPFNGIRAPAPEHKRDRWLDDRELRSVLLAARDLGPPFGAVVELLILLGQRCTEIAGMEWTELDLDAGMLRLPASRVKNKRAHSLPLPRQAVDLLRRMPRVGQHVFTTDGRTSITAGSGWFGGKLRERLREPIAAFTIHDLRRSCATGLARIGVALPVVEKILNHSSGSFAGVVAVYQHYSFEPEMRHALQRWADHLDRVLAGEQAASNVISLRG